MVTEERQQEPRQITLDGDGDDDYDYLFKVVFTGDSAVGKTNIMNGIAKSAPFEYQHIETIGVEFSTTTMKVDGMQIKLQMWDVAAKTLKGETYSESAITTAYYKGAIGVFFVYDITKRETFDSIADWLKAYAVGRPEDDGEAIKVLVGNKTDVNAKRTASVEEAEKFAANNSMLFFETSAKNRDDPSLDKLSRGVVTAILERLQPLEDRAGREHDEFANAKVTNPSNKRFPGGKARVIHPYTRQLNDELELQVDDIITVHAEFTDGWGKGENERTKQTGSFPLVALEPVN